jgi:hypothetical protein
VKITQKNHKNTVNTTPWFDTPYFFPTNSNTAATKTNIDLKVRRQTIRFGRRKKPKNENHKKNKTETQWTKQRERDVIVAQNEQGREREVAAVLIRVRNNGRMKWMPFLKGKN